MSHHAIVVAMLNEVKAIPTPNEYETTSKRVVEYFMGLAEIAQAGILDPAAFMQFANDVARLIALASR